MIYPGNLIQPAYHTFSFSAPVEIDWTQTVTWYMFFVLQSQHLYRRKNWSLIQRMEYFGTLYFFSLSSLFSLLFLLLFCPCLHVCLFVSVGHSFIHSGMKSAHELTATMGSMFKYLKEGDTARNQRYRLHDDWFIMTLLNVLQREITRSTSLSRYLLVELVFWPMQNSDVTRMNIKVIICGFIGKINQALLFPRA